MDTGSSSTGGDHHEKRIYASPCSPNNMKKMNTKNVKKKIKVNTRGLNNMFRLAAFLIREKLPKQKS